MMLGMAMQSFVIVYERFHMDPMKRGLVNQLCTTYMVFAMCQSIVCIFRDILRLVVPQPMPTFVYQTLGLAAWFNWSLNFGYSITINQVIFFTYWSKMWLKRVPDYNHDFLAAWLSVTNTVVAFYLGGLQAYNIHVSSFYRIIQRCFLSPMHSIFGMNIIDALHQIFDHFNPSN